MQRIVISFKFYMFCSVGIDFKFYFIFYQENPLSERSFRHKFFVTARIYAWTQIIKATLFSITNIDGFMLTIFWDFAIFFSKLLMFLFS